MMEENLNSAQGQQGVRLDTLEESLKNKRSIVVVKTNENVEDLSLVEGFIEEVEEMKEKGEISEAEYYKQIVSLYSELFSDIHEKLLAKGLSEEEAIEQNPWDEKYEDKASEVSLATRRITADKEKEKEMSALRTWVAARTHALYGGVLNKKTQKNLASDEDLPIAQEPLN